ncbi:hypothetical protein FPOA_04452 [Fusarium poae]|uniref:Uncharacterized protein n=2 Tax=Fusarium poae TaxID=36050 RepID=A0A1B8AU67_FUSPO|nr:hypothetical protein FPOA_04452 [Fusarium poae]
MGSLHAECDFEALLEEMKATRESRLSIEHLQNPSAFDDKNIDIPNMSLFKFITFDGVEAYQPCSWNLNSLSESLCPIETGDPVFSEARNWSCTEQARRNLPKEARWILATIYNFACVMLGHDRGEDSHWDMRPWLAHLYNVADRLFLKYDISATAPDPDWFSRPLGPPECPEPLLTQGTVVPLAD